jgi:uncharacterized RDD family membrane protein YckC
MAYEGLLLLGLLSILFLFPHVVLGMALNIAAPKWILIIHVFTVLGIYFVWCWNHGGQTLAMQTWKLRIATPDGQSPTLQRLLLRYTLAWPSLIFYGAGLLWALFDRDRQFLHDRLAGTWITSADKGA